MGTPRKQENACKSAPGRPYRKLLEEVRMKAATCKLEIARLEFSQEEQEARARAKLLTIVNRLMPQAGAQAQKGKPRLLATLARILKNRTVRVHV